MAKFHIYKDKAGEYRWRLVAANGNVIADSGQGYASKQKCQEGVASVKKHAADAEVVEDS